jgi:Golgi phosphoprotein 3 (GPP34)
MTLSEDLLLLAISPRNGSIQAMERVGLALRATELIELAHARRVTCVEGRITVADPTPLGDPRLDPALAEFRDRVPEPTLDTWLRARRPDEPGPLRRYGLVPHYLSDLVRAGVVRVDSPNGKVSPSTRVVIRDTERRDRIRARIDRLVSGTPDTAAEDGALGVVVRVCGLDRQLFRGLRGRVARQRLAGLAEPGDATLVESR